MSKKVRVGATYVFKPVPIDRFLMAPQAVKEGWLKEGDLVKVINCHGCPPANTMGHCYIEKDGKFCGMVCTNSLVSRR